MRLGTGGTSGAVETPSTIGAGPRTCSSPGRTALVLDDDEEEDDDDDDEEDDGVLPPS